MGNSSRLTIRDKPWLIPLVALLLITVIFWGISAKVAAFVGGKIITPAELEHRLDIIQFSYDLQFGHTDNYEPDFARQNRRQVLAQLAEEHLLLKAAEGLATQEEQADYASELLEWLQSQLFQGDEAGFQEKLAKHQLDEVRLSNYFSNTLLLTRLHEQVVAEIMISEDETQAYYEEHKTSFAQPEMIKVAHILVAEEAEAGRLLEELQQGTDFALLAKQYSLDSESAAHGGTLQWFSRGQMEPQFEEAAFALEPGEISPIIATSHGYHIIRAEAKDPAKEQAYEQVAKQASERALAVKQDTAWNQFRQQLQESKLILLLAR
jgi:parvulin-like peptidyl-prolyl isomerase